jgi:hypothetical protein
LFKKKEKKEKEKLGGRSHPLGHQGVAAQGGGAAFPFLFFFFEKNIFKFFFEKKKFN